MSSLGRSGLLTSAVRTATTSSADVEAGEARGVTVYVDVTADPANSETIAVQVEAKDPASGTYTPVTTNATVADTVTPSTELYTLYPGIAETVATTHHQVAGVPVPRVFRVKVTHSGSGNWTYTVGCDLLP